MTACTASGTTSPVANLFRVRRSRFRARSDNRRDDSLTAPSAILRPRKCDCREISIAACTNKYRKLRRHPLPELARVWKSGVPR